MIDRIMSCISEHPEGISDTTILKVLNGKHRAQIYNYCRELERLGYVERRGLSRPILNFATNLALQYVPKDNVIQHSSSNKMKTQAVHDWSWEAILHTVVEHLGTVDYQIIRTSSTDSKGLRNDIEAKKDDTELWINVKGYPMKNKTTHIPAQAKTWFSSMVFDILSKRGENPEANFAVALPDYPRYRTLSQQVEWLQKSANISFIWVREDGSVEWTEKGI
jgi:hypothetical protein